MVHGHILQVEDLRTYIHTLQGVVRAVDGVYLHLGEGNTLAIVGESGCGKTMTALSILRLLPPGGRIEGGRILYQGRDLTVLSEAEMRKIRGKEIAMVFQEPSVALNPVLTVGEQVAEGLRLHLGLGRKEAEDRAVELLEAVGIPDARTRARSYPHQLSGGMKQRVVIAMALAADPSLLIADEPTTALDVSVQAQIVDLLLRLKEERNLSLVLITHNLGLVASFADETAVMYLGKVVEYGPTDSIIESPLHPYTRGLIASLPNPSRPLEPIPGNLPSPLERMEGCPFHPRCRERRGVCERYEPPLLSVDGTKVRCWLYEKVG